jgi:diaminopimelate epimerase
MRFTKMHGLGNDYVYVNGFGVSVADPAGLARHISDRHFGVGSDGLILVLPPDITPNPQQSPSELPGVRMRMFNADGSEAEMCGNGVRCVCKFAHDAGLSRDNPMRIQTGRGVLTLPYHVGADGKVDEVTVDMGPPILRPSEIPVDLPVAMQELPGAVNVPLPVLPVSRQLRDDWYQDGGVERRMTCVSMGNPHAVIFCKNVAAVPLEAVGPLLETHPMFPRRINVHFAQVNGRGELTMRTWERGSGITLACGTGACAVAVAAVLTGRTERKLLIHLPGGDLRVRCDATDDHVHMTGPATEVFTGTWPD